MNTMHLAGLVVVMVVGVSAAALYVNSGNIDIPNNSNCTYGQMNYYFRSDCSHCQRVLADGSLEKLHEYGVQVTKLEVLDWGMYGIYATPTFEFGGQQVKGYKSFDEIKAMLGC